MIATRIAVPPYLWFALGRDGFRPHLSRAYVIETKTDKYVVATNGILMLAERTTMRAGDTFVPDPEHPFSPNWLLEQPEGDLSRERATAKLGRALEHFTARLKEGSVDHVLRRSSPQRMRALLRGLGVMKKSGEVAPPRLWGQNAIWRQEGSCGYYLGLMRRGEDFVPKDAIAFNPAYLLPALNFVWEAEEIAFANDTTHASGMALVLASYNRLRVAAVMPFAKTASTFAVKE